MAQEEHPVCVLGFAGMIACVTLLC